MMSPMVLSTFLAGFGLIGLLVAIMAPWLGNFTLVPAFMAGCTTTALMRMWFRWVIKNAGVTSNAVVSELPGQLAEVSVGIAPGHVGEVTYVVQSKRLTSAAKCHSGKEIRKGTKVVIVQTNDHVLDVEPCEL
jgi:membrane protein implicated in regulation of membrane protease activity